jgi:hypothetical protein
MGGADSRTRTDDRRFTKPLLYQLSYAGRFSERALHAERTRHPKNHGSKRRGCKPPERIILAGESGFL